MVEHFNELEAYEAELLALLAEECGEVVQAIGKILRHGIGSYNPSEPSISNRDRLTREMGDVRAAMILLCEAGVISKDRVHAAADDKRARIGKYLHHYAPTVGDKS